MNVSDGDSDSSLSCEHKRHKHKKSSHKHRDKEKKRKRHKDGKDHHKDKKEKRSKRSRHDDVPAVDVERQSTAAWEAFAAVVVANPHSRGELKMLLQMLDAGQMVVLESIEDPAMRSRLESALTALGLPTQVLDDGSQAHYKPEAATLSLRDHFASLFDGIPTADDAADESPSQAAPLEPEPPAKPDGPPAASRRVYGVAQRPEGAEESIGPALPPPDDPDEDEEDDDAVGPTLPAGLDHGAAASSVHVGGGGGESAKPRWWEQADTGPKPSTAAAAAEALAAPTVQKEHDEWMTSLPSDRVGFNPMEARQFTRNGVQAQGDTSIWTDTGEDKVRKASQAQLGASDGGSGRGASQPMTLADAVAIAQANAAAGKRPRPAGGSGLGGGNGGSDGPAAKSLVDVNLELKAGEKAKKGKAADWEGQHPWRPWDRDKDLDIRQVNPKGKEVVLNDQIMGSLGDRFGGAGRRETSFM